MTQFTVGQKLWFSPERRYGHAAYDTITKIGREWITMSGHHPHRFRKDDPDMRADGKGYTSPGRFYLSKEACEEEHRLNARYNALAKCLPTYHRPKHITDADMDELVRIFKLEEKNATGCTKGEHREVATIQVQAGTRPGDQSDSE